MPFLLPSLIETIDAKNNEVYDEMKRLRDEKVVDVYSKHANYDEAIPIIRIDPSSYIKIRPHWLGTRETIPSFDMCVEEKTEGTLIIEQRVVNPDEHDGFYLENLSASSVPDAIAAIHRAFDRLHPDHVRAVYAESKRRAEEGREQRRAEKRQKNQ